MQKQSPEFKEVQIQSRDSVRLVLFNERGEFLVVTEKDDPANLKLPGGKIDPDDTSIWGAASRELAEELGKLPEEVGLKGIGILNNDDGKVRRFICTGRISQSQLTPSDEINSVQWFTESSLPDCLNRNHILTAAQLARTVADTAHN